MDSDTSPRSLILHYQEFTQRVKFFPLGSTMDLKAGICDLLGFSEGVVLRFRDADGDIVILSASGIPNETVLHVTVETGMPIQQNGRSANSEPALSSSVVSEPSTNILETADFKRWKECSGRASISDDFLCFSSKASDNPFLVVTEAWPTTGCHYMVIETERYCCCSVGFLPLSISSVPISKWNSGKYNSLLSLKGIGTSDPFNHFTSSNGPITMGVFLDCEKKICIFVDHNDPSNPEKTHQVIDIQLPTRLILQGPKHALHATIHPTELVPPTICKDTSRVVEFTEDEDK